MGGSGPTDIVWMSSFLASIVDQPEVPQYRRFLTRLASAGRLIRFDRRGIGMSDPLPTLDPGAIEAWADDALVVLDAVGSERAALVGEVTAKSLILLAAAHPERVSALVLNHIAARHLWAPDYPIGFSEAELQEVLDRPLGGRADGALRTLEAACPSGAADPAFRQWFVRATRRGGPSFARAILEVGLRADVRAVLSEVRVPTLAFNRTGVRNYPALMAYVAEHIPGAVHVEFPGQDFMIFLGDSDPIIDAIIEFVTGDRPPVEVDRVLATVLFTDFVGSTAQNASMGDGAWRPLLDTHDHLVDQELSRHQGRRVKSTGDGILATFDGPARAIRCALALRDSLDAVGLFTRAGLHTGEVELRGEDIAGMAVNIGSRVEALAAPGEVLVSSTVKDLVIGSGIQFEERGDHELKGVPGRWQLYRVTS